ncbi:hypothetical protein [uncultured Dialister sp.]|uniref:Ppx/GppA phosphatase family protein n=1 Tax=uncultured Dialister sp. TaxID=278064 RepID=UPI0025F4EF93|nr:hypothetical protein [uncultured Dialister sp.]
MLHGIIDIGSSTIRMAIYFIDENHMEMLMKKKHTIGLAAYIRDGCMTRAGIDKTVEIVEEFKGFLSHFPLTSVHAFTTAALRNAKNSREAVGEIERRTAIPIRVISGDEEAYLDYVGAVHNHPAGEGLLVDIGGGSTEIVAFGDEDIRFKTSLPMGSLSLRSEFVKGFLPTGRECLAMRKAAEERIGRVSELSSLSSPVIIGMGGTFKSACSLYNLLYHKDKNNTVMDRTLLEKMMTTFRGDNPLTEEKSILLMKAVPDRMHTILSGLIIALVLSGHFHAGRITYSDTGVREGYIYEEIWPKYGLK